MASKKKTSKTTAARSRKKSAAKKPAARPAAAKSVKSETLSLTSAAPGFTVADIEKSLAWYRDVLGFSVKDRWENDGKLMGVELAAGKVSFMIGQDDWKKGRDRIKGQGVRIYCLTTQDIDRVAARIKGQGGTLTQEPVDQPWGMRELAVDDPDGFKITIASELKKR